jgi:hypothetical protein
MLCLFSLILPVALIVDQPFTSLRLAAYAVSILNWVVLPGLALLLGAMPFLRIPMSPKLRPC